MATPQDNVVSLTNNSLIDGLIQGSAWTFSSGPRNVTYSLSINDNPSGGAWSVAMANAMRSAFSLWSNVANITFTETGSGSVYTSSPADIAVILTGNEIQSALPGAIALGIFPSPSFGDTFLSGIGESRATYPRLEGDIALDNYHVAYGYASPGGIGFLTMIHEIGHALGLKHTEDDGGNGRPTFAALGIGHLDNNLYTVMSYTDAQYSAFGTNRASGNAATPMPLDILAIQQIYGANTAFHATDDVYVFPADGAVRTIWDAGGFDVLDASAATTGGVLNLATDVGLVKSKFGGSVVEIAVNVVIEKAIGGSGGDYLYANDAGSILDGGPGNDNMWGGYGDDTFIVDSTGDYVSDYYSGGHDTVIASVDFQLPDTVEDLQLISEAGLIGHGNDFANTITGSNSADKIIGEGGDDIVTGGLGRDTILGGGGIDTASYANATSGIIASTGNGIAVDWVLAEGSWVVAVDSEILDSIENLEGGTGNDALYGDAGVNVLNGNAGNDQLYGLAGEDVLAGGTGNDFLQGGPGNDILSGGPDKDTLAGGIGEDSFRFDALPDAATNIDVISDFAHGADRILLDNDIFAAFTAIGALPAGTFVSGVGQTAANDANDFLIYDSSTGALYYDPDGNGTSAATQFATLTGHPALTASDFVVS